MTQSEPHDRPTLEGLTRAGAHHARRMLSAYSGEHGIYGTVLVTALIAVNIADETDWDVFVFVIGTIGVFWLAHVYAWVVASRSQRPAPPLRESIARGARHSFGMVVAMLIPALLLLTGTIGLLNEWVAYWIALFSGVVVLGVIGYLNARRNGSSWPWRIAGVLSTTIMGLIVIALSILVH